MSAIGVRADNMCSLRVFRLLTQCGHRPSPNDPHPARIQRARLDRYDALSSEGAVLRRRDFMAFAGGVVAIAPFAARAQQPERMRLIGVLLPATADDAEMQARIAAFHQ